MNPFPSVFPVWWIALTALTAFGSSAILLAVLKSRLGLRSVLDILLLAAVTGLSVFAWRSAGNVPVLNNDPIPPFSPNDLLCPLVSFVMLEVYAVLRPPSDPLAWARVRALLTLVSFVVNVLTI